MQFTYCPHPACGAVAEIVDRFVFPATDGFIEHAKVQCLHRHLFTLPVDRLRPNVVDAAISTVDKRVSGGAA
jgi:hypothetical protein